MYISSDQAEQRQESSSSSSASSAPLARPIGAAGRRRVRRAAGRLTGSRPARLSRQPAEASRPGGRGHAAGWAADQAGGLSRPAPRPPGRQRRPWLGAGARRAAARARMGRQGMPERRIATRACNVTVNMYRRERRDDSEHRDLHFSSKREGKPEAD